MDRAMATLRWGDQSLQRPGGVGSLEPTHQERFLAVDVFCGVLGKGSIILFHFDERGPKLLEEREFGVGYM